MRRARAARVGVLVAASAALLLSACAGSPAPGASSTSTSRTPSKLVVNLPLYRCQTTFAVALSTTTTLPATVSAGVPANRAADLVAYSDDHGIMMLIGPRGWTCSARYGADGSGGLLISPAGESVPSDPDAGWQLPASSSVQAIVGYEVGASPVQGAALACPFFSAAAAVYQQSFGHGCTAHPTAESVEGTGSSEAGFEDPAGVRGDGMPSGGTNPANGVVLYLPGQDKSAAYLATCTLPVDEHDVCTAVLNHFITLYG